MIRQQDGKILETQIESTEDFDYQNLLIMKYLEVNWGLLGTSSSLQELNRINNNSLKQEKNLMRKAGKKLKDGGFDKGIVNRAVKVANNFKEKRARAMMRMTPEFYVKGIKQLIKNKVSHDLSNRQTDSLEQLLKNIRGLEQRKDLGKKQKRVRLNDILQRVLTKPEFRDVLEKVASQLWIEAEAKYFKSKQKKDGKIGAPPIKLINDILDILESDPIKDYRVKPKYSLVQEFIRQVISPAEYTGVSLRNRIFELRLKKIYG